MSSAATGTRPPVDPLISLLDRPVPRVAWLVLVLAILAVWAAPAIAGGVGSNALDWRIYADARDLWLTHGTPYTVPPPGWDPDVLYPYLYPPTSWPLLLMTFLPWPIVLVGLVPIALTPPRLGPAVPAAVLLALSVGPAVYYGNVNVLVAGLLVLAFRPGAVGGLSLGAAGAIKAYPLALLPLLWGDRRRVAWTIGSLIFLAATGTVLFGPGAWVDFLTTLSREGPYSDSVLFNPLAGLGVARVLIAGSLAIVGFGLGSPTVVLLGATWVSPGTTIHYLLTFAAILCVEPPLRDRPLPAASWAARLRALRHPQSR